MTWKIFKNIYPFSTRLEWTPLPIMESGVCWEFLLIGDSIVTVRENETKIDFEDLFVFSYLKWWNKCLEWLQIFYVTFCLKKTKKY